MCSVAATAVGPGVVGVQAGNDLRDVLGCAARRGPGRCSRSSRRRPARSCRPRPRCCRGSRCSPENWPLASVAKAQRVTVGKLCWPAAKPSLARWQAEQPVSPASPPERRATFEPLEFSSMRLVAVVAGDAAAGPLRDEVVDRARIPDRVALVAAALRVGQRSPVHVVGAGVGAVRDARHPAVGLRAVAVGALGAGGRGDRRRPLADPARHVGVRHRVRVAVADDRAAGRRRCCRPCRRRSSTKSASVSESVACVSIPEKCCDGRTVAVGAGGRVGEVADRGVGRRCGSRG